MIHGLMMMVVMKMNVVILVKSDSLSFLSF